MTEPTTGPTTMAGRVREWLAANATKEDGRTFTEIRLALDLSTVVLHRVLHVQRDLGFVGAAGKRTRMIYWRTEEPVRPPGRPVPTREARLAKQRVIAARRRRRKGIPTRAEIIAKQKADAAARKAREEAHRRAQAIVREMARKERAEAKAIATKQSKSERSKLLRTASVRARRVGESLSVLAQYAESKPQSVAAPKPERPAETIEQWKKRTGKDVERLAPGVVCEREQLKGHHAINAASWQARNHA